MSPYLYLWVHFTPDLHDFFKNCFSAVKKIQDGVKVDIKNMADHVNNDLRKAIRMIGDQLHSIATKRTEEISRLNDALHKVQIGLVAKKELREKDSEHWAQKYNTLSKEKEELARKMDEVSGGDLCLIGYFDCALL